MNCFLGFNLFLASCKIEIWSGENFSGSRAVCTGECDMQLGSVGNDRAKSAKCTCEFKQNSYLINYIFEKTPRPRKKS